MGCGIDLGRVGNGDGEWSASCSDVFSPEKES